IAAPLSTIPAPLSTISAPLSTISAPVSTIPAPLSVIPAPLSTISAPFSTIPDPTASPSTPTLSHVSAMLPSSNSAFFPHSLFSITSASNSNPFSPLPPSMPTQMSPSLEGYRDDFISQPLSPSFQPPSFRPIPTHSDLTPLSPNLCSTPTSGRSTTEPIATRDERRLALVHGRKLDAINRRLDTIELMQRKMASNIELLIRLVSSNTGQSNNQPTTAPHTVTYTDTDESGSVSTPVVMDEDPFVDIPLPYRLDVATLRRIHAHSSNPGNYARNLVEKIYPELFQEDSQRLNYSYFGGGVLSKKELDPSRKVFLERYVLYLHPELKDNLLWKDRIVPKINECLRRPVKRTLHPST
ncbi:flocculation protein FLO11-like, partial [Pecten maximus]|uniref:flocculation protein FLO11-like n=1 Tax=Pecten maximus TaxID=6579 RepID=UPI0014580C56